MGTSSVYCNISRLSIYTNKVVLIPIHLTQDQNFIERYVPMMLPIFGTRDADTWSIVDIETDDNTKIIEQVYNMNIDEFCNLLTNNKIPNTKFVYILRDVYDKIIEKDYNRIDEYTNWYDTNYKVINELDTLDKIKLFYWSWTVDSLFINYELKISLLMNDEFNIKKSINNSIRTNPNLIIVDLINEYVLNFTDDIYQLVKSITKLTNVMYLTNRTFEPYIIYGPQHNEKRMQEYLLTVFKDVNKEL